MKLFLNKIWVWGKTYWYILIIVIIGTIALLLGQNKDVKKVFDLIGKERDLAKKEIEIIEITNKNKEKDLKKNRDRHDASKKELEEQHAKDEAEFDSKKEKMTADLANNINENPSKILSRIAEEMGWDYKK